MQTLPADTIDQTGGRPHLLLRPLDLRGLLDRAFRVYRGHFVTLIALVAVLYVPAWLLVSYFNRIVLGSSSDLLPEASGAGNAVLIASGLYLFANILLPTVRALLVYPAQGAAAAFVEDMYLGELLPVEGAYQRVLRRLGALLGIAGVQALIVVCMTAPLPLLTLAERATSETPNAATTICLVSLLSMAMLVVGEYTSVRFALAVPATMVEGTGTVQSLRRSWDLTAGNWWRTFGLLTLLLGVVQLVMVAGPVLLIEEITGTLARAGTIEARLIALGAEALVTMLFLPVELLVTALYYFDLRVRREGLDLETDIARQYQPTDVPTIFAREMGDTWVGTGGETVEEIDTTPGGYSPLSRDEWAGRVKSRGSGPAGDSGSRIRRVPVSFPEHRG